MLYCTPKPDQLVFYESTNIHNRLHYEIANVGVTSVDISNIILFKRNVLTILFKALPSLRTSNKHINIEFIQFVLIWLLTALCSQGLQTFNLFVMLLIHLTTNTNNSDEGISGLVIPVKNIKLNRVFYGVDGVVLFKFHYGFPLIF